MTTEQHPYAETRAASLLAEALRRHTSEHPGGLRAVAAELGIKQATVLSHMAHGRIGIPLDRAAELARKLGMDTTSFCLAVLKQRAPEVYDALDGDLVREVSALPESLMTVLRMAGSRSDLTEEHVNVIAEVLATKHPHAQWMRPLEGDIIKVIRERYPEGMTLSESREVIGWIRLMADE